MSNLISIGICPHCDGGHKTGCYAEYADGYKCFSCGISKSFDSHRMAIMGKAALRPITMAKDMYVPKHTRNTREFSPQVLKWLYSYYVYDKLIKKHRIGYVGDTGEWGDSLLLPVIDDGEIVFVTRRFFPNKRVLGIGTKQPYKIKNGNKRVILVEDYISAIRLEEFADVYCLFGTYLNRGEVKPLLDEYDEVILWLDGDEAGRKGVKNITKQLNYKINENKRKFPLKYPKGWSIVNITSKEDPKYYSPTQVKEFLT